MIDLHFLTDTTDRADSLNLTSEPMNTDTIYINKKITVFEASKISFAPVVTYRHDKKNYTVLIPKLNVHFNIHAPEKAYVTYTKLMDGETESLTYFIGETEIWINKDGVVRVNQSIR